MATARGTRPSPQDHKPKASRVAARRREALTYNDIPQDKLDEASAELRVTIPISTALGEDTVTVLSPLEWPYDCGEKLEAGYLGAWVEGAVAGDDAEDPDPDDEDDPGRPSSQERLKALQPKYGDIMRLVANWREAMDDTVGKLSAS